MPDGITAVRPDLKTADNIQLMTVAMEKYVREVASPSCARFYVFMEQVGRDPGLRAILGQAIGASTTLVQIENARKAIEILAHAVAGLDSGKYELVAWTVDMEPPPGVDYSEWFKIGVFPKGYAQSVGKASGMDWLPVPILLRFALGIGAAVGAYVLALYMQAEKAKQEADYLRAQTESMIANRIAEAQPADRQGLANAFDVAKRAADSAANQGGKGWLSSIGGAVDAVGDLATAAVKTTTELVGSASDWLPWALGAYVVVSTLGSLSNIFGGRRCCD